MKSRSIESGCPLLALLVGVMAWVFFSEPVRAEDIKIGGTGAAMATMRILGEAFQQSHPELKIVIVPGLGSGGGRKALLGGAIDIGVTSNAGMRVEKLEGGVAVLYGTSPFVFATSKKNPASALTIQEVVDIWDGKTTTWRDGQRLRLILRPATDSDTDILKSISPAMERAVKSALSREGLKMAITDGDSADAIQAIPGALGTSILALVIAEERSLKAFSFNGVMPSPKTIADGSYPYFKSFYMLTVPRPSRLTQQFVSFVQSTPSREILARLGHWVGDAK